MLFSANEKPTARASIDVATARTSIVPTENEELFSASGASFESASRIIFTPIIRRSPKAIQWSNPDMYFSNCLPRK